MRHLLVFPVALLAITTGCGGGDELSPTPLTPEDCFDGNACTIDEVVDDACAYTTRPDGFFGCDGPQTVLGCSSGIPTRDAAVDLFVLTRSQSDRVWGFIGCEEDGDGGITIGLFDEAMTYPSPVCSVGEEACLTTTGIVDDYFGTCRTFTTSTGTVSEPLWEVQLCDDYCRAQGQSGSSGCRADRSDCACF